MMPEAGKSSCYRCQRSKGRLAWRQGRTSAGLTDEDMQSDSVNGAPHLDRDRKSRVKDWEGEEVGEAEPYQSS